MRIVKEPTNIENDSQHEIVYRVDLALRQYGSSDHGNQTDPLDELIYILLSAQTESYAYVPVYKRLKSEMRDWSVLLSTSEEQLRQVLKPCGLSAKKARWLKGAIETIARDIGQVSLGFLRSLCADDVYSYLVSLPGVGNKTANCIMMYSLNLSVFPVDTHVWRISRRLGWTMDRPKPRLKDERALESLIPPEIRYDLHVNMVSHGQATCTAYNPKCAKCPIRELCPSRDKADSTWISWRDPQGVWKLKLALEEK